MPKIPSKAKIKKEISPAKKFLSQVNPLDWFVLGLFIAFSLFHILLIFFGRNLLTVVSTFLFQILNLVLAVYFAVRITTKSVIDKVTEKQKGIAKTAIRQNIISQSINNNIIKIVKEKIECFKNTKMKDALNDINNHLEILSQSIGSSEFAFKDILDEELREEHQTWSKIRGLENLVKEKIIQQSEIDKKKVANAEGQINKIASEVSKLRNQISNYKLSLPITGSLKLTEPKYLSGISPITLSDVHYPNDWLKIRDEWRLKPENLSSPYEIGKGIPIGDKEEKEDEVEKSEKEVDKKKQNKKETKVKPKK